jgi:hypothetical protein
MKIKLTKEALTDGGLCSSSSHQGFAKTVWNELNNGGTVEVDSIPDICKGKLEEVSTTTSKKSGGK